MQIQIKEMDVTRLHFEKALGQVGERLARLAFSRALNRDGNKTRTQVKRALRGQTGIKAGTINAGISTRPSSPSTLTYIIEGRGKPLPLSHFGARQFSYGVKASPWNVARKFASAFIVNAYGGNAFHRLSSSRFPIEGMFGPGVANELIKDESADTWRDAQPEVIRQATEQIARMLPGL